jgi:hypothetical protein
VSVNLNLRSCHAVVRFRQVSSDEKIGSELLSDPNGDDFDVAVERTPSGEIVGIELLGFDSRIVAAAETFAREHGFAFPAEAFERFAAALAAA